MFFHDNGIVSNSQDQRHSPCLVASLVSGSHSTPRLTQLLGILMCDISGSTIFSDQHCSSKGIQLLEYHQEYTFCVSRLLYYGYSNVSKCLFHSSYHKCSLILTSYINTIYKNNTTHQWMSTIIYIVFKDIWTVHQKELYHRVANLEATQQLHSPL